MKPNIKTLALLTIALTLLGCKSKTENAQNNVSDAKSQFNPERNIVDTMTLTAVDFNREIISNGNLRAARRAELHFLTQGEVAKVFVKNGTKVTQGTAIAKLKDENLRIKLEQAQNNLEKAELDFKDNLIGFGYGTDTTKVPKETLKIAKIKSGYINALQDLNTVKRDLYYATLRAPFNGVIANLKVKPYENIPSEAACLVIDNSSFDVEFNLLEGELAYIKEGLTVSISPYTNLQERFTGVIKEINPIVDDKGQIKITASIKNIGNSLIDGMNVKVYIESLLKHQLTVPKSAVVIRDGYDVIFTLNPQTNRVTWVYVDIVTSNSTHHIIKGSEYKNTTIQEGEIIVTSGNLNLADNSKVEIKPNL